MTFLCHRFISHLTIFIFILVSEKIAYSDIDFRGRLFLRSFPPSNISSLDLLINAKTEFYQTASCLMRVEFVNDVKRNSRVEEVQIMVSFVLLFYCSNNILSVLKLLSEFRIILKCSTIYWTIISGKQRKHRAETWWR